MARAARSAEGRSRIVLAAALLLTSTGCIKRALVNGQIEGTRRASAAFDTIADYELAGAAASSGIVQFEGMHVLAPDNLDALFLLEKAWTGYGYGYAEDAMEAAEDEGDRELAAYHKARAVRAYERAIGYGLELMSHRAEGFAEAKTAEAPLKAWLEQNFTDPEQDAPELFWLAYAWIARTNILKDDAESVANLFVGVQIMERVRALDPSYNNYSPLVVLGAYHGRTAAADLEASKALFEEAIAKTERKSLIALFNYGAKYACSRADAGLYVKLLTEVVNSEDDTPALRLTNTVARRRAMRWLGEKRMFDACGIEPPPPGATEPEPSSAATPNG